MIRSDGTLVRDYFYVEDGVDAYMLLAERAARAGPSSRGEAFNFSNEIQVTVLDLVRTILAEMGSDARARRPQRGATRDRAPVPERRQGARACSAGRRRSTLDAGLGRTDRLVPGLPGAMPRSPEDELPPARSSICVAEYHAAAFPPRAFVPGESPVPVSGRVFDAEELQHRWSRRRSTSG